MGFSFMVTNVILRYSRYSSCPLLNAKEHLNELPCVFFKDMVHETEKTERGTSNPEGIAKYS